MASSSASFHYTSPTRRLHRSENQNYFLPYWFLAYRNSISPTPSIPNRRQNYESVSGDRQRGRCACSPSSDPGFFRCFIHRARTRTKTASFGHPSGSLDLRVLAIRNSLAKMGKVSEAGKIDLKHLDWRIFRRRRQPFVSRRSPLSGSSKADR